MSNHTVLIPVLIDGVELQVEATPLGGSQRTSNIDKARETVLDAFEKAQDAIVAVAASTVETVARLGSRAVEPDEVQVKFGLKFTAKGSVVVAEASGEASLEIALTYRRIPKASKGEDEARSGTDVGH